MSKCLVCQIKALDVEISLLPSSKYRKNNTLINDKNTINLMIDCCGICFEKLWETKWHPDIKGFYKIKNNKPVSVFKKNKEGVRYVAKNKILQDKKRQEEKIKKEEEIDKIFKECFK